MINCMEVEFITSILQTKCKWGTLNKLSLKMFKVKDSILLKYGIYVITDLLPLFNKKDFDMTLVYSNSQKSIRILTMRLIANEIDRIRVKISKNNFIFLLRID